METRHNMRIIFIRLEQLYLAFFETTNKTACLFLGTGFGGALERKRIKLVQKFLYYKSCKVPILASSIQTFRFCLLLHLFL